MQRDNTGIKLKTNKKKKVIFLERLKARVSGCLNCGYTEAILPLNTRLYQSFGGYMVTKNGELFFMEDTKKEYNKSKTLRAIEKMIGDDDSTKNDYRVILDLPLRSAEYQRQEKNKWYLVKTGQGFA